MGPRTIHHPGHARPAASRRGAAVTAVTVAVFVLAALPATAAAGRDGHRLKASLSIELNSSGQQTIACGDGETHSGSATQSLKISTLRPMRLVTAPECAGCPVHFGAASALKVAGSEKRSSSVPSCEPPPPPRCGSRTGTARFTSGYGDLGARTTVDLLGPPGTNWNNPVSGDDLCPLAPAQRTVITPNARYEEDTFYLKPTIRTSRLLSHRRRRIVIAENRSGTLRGEDSTATYTLKYRITLTRTR